MWRPTTALFLALYSSVAHAVSIGASADPAQFVNHFIGTANGGHVFAGATLPYGSVKAVADSLSGDNQAGYVSDGSPIQGISQLHDDGTGGGASLGNFPLMPFTSANCAGNNLTQCPTDTSARALAHGDPSASPGYFMIPLNNGITSEITVTHSTVLHRFTYPNTSDPQILLLDLTTDLSRSFMGDGSVALTKTATGTRISGNGRFGPSFGEGSYEVFFCFDGPAFTEATFYQGSNFSSVNATFSANLPSAPAGIIMKFTPPANHVLNIRMAISWTSAQKACSFGQSEIPDLGAFDTVKAAARAKWNDVLGTVSVNANGVSKDVQEIFWSSLYRTHISPYNITGDNPLWNSTEPFYDSFYCMWDSFRDVHPLWAIVAPNTQAEVVRALIDIYRHEGWLPDCRMSLDKGFTQGGSNADSVLSDSFVKGIKAGIDWQAGLEAVLKDATVEGDFSVEGRGGIKERKQLGFIPVDVNDDPPNEGPDTRSASRLLEYSYNDFSIALIAKGLGRQDLFNQFVKASGDWANIWNPNVTNTGFSGFIQPRNANGTFFLNPTFDLNNTFNPTHCSPVFGHEDCFLFSTGGEFYEASSWEYSFYAPHDMAKLIKLMGGPQTFSARLDTLFSAGYHDIGDEPGFLPTFLYNYVGQPTKTVDRVQSILDQFFNTSINGLPGNDDSGAMGAYVVWTHLGFYPVAGQSTYLLCSPFFPEVTFQNQATGAISHVTAINFGGANKYVQSATLNGKPYTKNWISHDLFEQGGTLELVLGPSKNSKWGTGPGDLPPSLSTGGFV
ncbi:glycoside hydrolase family 92 protein [Sphaerobolus stellatus SS14]|nr:glycoside hydrolase family 92 protein [Sphaerobolus stellatus SS14]